MKYDLIHMIKVKIHNVERPKSWHRVCWNFLNLVNKKTTSLRPWNFNEYENNWR